MKLQLAVADFSFPLLPHERALDLAAAVGFEGVDIGLFEGRSHLLPSRELVRPNRSGHRLRAKLRPRGLACADVFLQMAPDFTSFALNHPTVARRRKAREWYRRTLEYAAEAGAEHVTLLPGTGFAGESRTDSWARCLEELAWRVEQAHPYSMVLGVEAHVGSIASTPRAAAELVDSVAGLTLTLDYTHFTRVGIPDSDVEPLTRFASHFHARGARRGRLQSSLSRNTIDYRRVMRILARFGYSGYVGIEYVWIDWEHCNEVDNLSETILMRDFLRRVCPHP